MSEADPPQSKVGYGNPPKEHQFKKGVSGNPSGRPRGKRKAPQAPTLEFGTQPANAMLIAEAYRLVTIREGDQTIQLPAIQAVFRAMNVAAMKGNRFAQRTLAELVGKIEEDDRRSRMELFETMVDYKLDWERAIEACVARGEKPPEPLPHPDDIIIDLAQSRAEVCGPSTKEEKENWDRMLEYIDELQEDVSMWAEKYRRSRNAEKKETALHFWKLHQRMFNRLNDNLPKRYRRKLKDVGYKAGFSLPGSERTREWLGE